MIEFNTDKSQVVYTEEYERVKIEIVLLWHLTPVFKPHFERFERYNMYKAMSINKTLELLKSWHSQELFTIEQVLEQLYYNHYMTNYEWYNDFFTLDTEDHLHACIDHVVRTLKEDFSHYNRYHLLDHKSHDYVNIVEITLTDFGQYVVSFINFYMTCDDSLIDYSLEQAIEKADCE